jgi:hypothetical protein
MEKIMFFEHPFWFCLTAGCVVWYSSITIYVALKGYADIKSMLKNLQTTHAINKEEKSVKETA